MTKMIVRHQELDVSKKALEAAMNIFEISRSFPKKKLTHSRAQFAGHPDRSVQIWPKLGESDDTVLRLSRRCVTPRERQQKLRRG